MAILRTVPNKDGLEAWRLICKEFGRQSWKSLHGRQAWLLSPGPARDYHHLAELVRHYENEYFMLKQADTKAEYEVGEAVRRGIIVQQIIGNRPETHRLYEEMIDPSTRARYPKLEDMIDRICEFCREYEPSEQSAKRKEVNNVNEAYGLDPWNQGGSNQDG